MAFFAAKSGPGQAVPRASTVKFDFTFFNSSVVIIFICYFALRALFVSGY
jgi:hypothetical protein